MDAPRGTTAPASQQKYSKGHILEYYILVHTTHKTGRAAGGVRTQNHGNDTPERVPYN